MIAVFPWFYTFLPLSFPCLVVMIDVLSWSYTFLPPAFTSLHVRLLWSPDFVHFAACSHLPSRTIAVVPWLRTFLLPAFTCLHVRLLWSCDFTHFCRLLSLAFTYDCCGPLISYIFAACFHWQVFHCSTSHDSHLVKSLYELLKFIETSTLLLLIVDFN